MYSRISARGYSPRVPARAARPALSATPPDGSVRKSISEDAQPARPARSARMLSLTPPVELAAALVGTAAVCAYAQCSGALAPPHAPADSSAVPCALFNCSPAPRVTPSSPVVWVAERPGRDGNTPSERDIDHWADHMRRRGVAQVLCLLGEKHLRLYNHLDGGLRQAVEQRGLQWASVPFNRERPLYEHLVAAAQQLRTAERAGESTVIHCSAGCGRSAAVVVAWMCGRGGESFDQAVSRLAKEAELEGVRRQPMEVGEHDLREACADLSLQWGSLALAAD